MTQVKTALVLGATGGIGGEVSAALLRHGWQVNGLIRDPAKAPHGSGQSTIRWLPGDAMNPQQVVQAAQGASLIVHAVNPPGYRNWAQLVLPMIDSSLAAARASGARILLPGTIYNYGPDAFPVLREDSPQNPLTRKGRIRVQMEQRLEAAQAEVRSLIVRAGDFFGPIPGNNWFSQGLVKPGRPVRSIANPASTGVGHSWAYLPDLAETMASLADREATLPTFARFHFGGLWDADGTSLVKAIQAVAAEAPGAPNPVPIRGFPWLLLSLLAPFNTTIREMQEMRYLWREPLRLDNQRLLTTLGKEPHTSLPQAVRATLTGLGCLPR